MDKLLHTLADDEVHDPEEESFEIFSQPIPSRSLGFVDNKALELDIAVAGKDFCIRQSPSLLVSNRKEGTTGAVLWQVTPRIAEWLASNPSLLFETWLNSNSNVLELGCGISGLLALSLAPKVKRYVATDQEYVLKVLRDNITQNQSGSRTASRKVIRTPANASTVGEIIPMALDWEQDSVSTLYQDLGIDADADQIHMVIACDCIYNDALIDPFVSTCADICALSNTGTPTLCIVAQQLRSPDVFESWLKSFHSKFRVWRLGDDDLSPDLRSGSGFVVHLGVLKTPSKS